MLFGLKSCRKWVCRYFSVSVSAFPKCWVARTTCSGCKENWTLCMWRSKVPLPLGTESSEPETFAHQNTKPPFTLGELMRHQEGKKRKKKTKTACGRLGVVGHVMQTPLHQWVGVETFNCADGRLKFLGLWRESQKHSVLNCDSAAAWNSRVHLSPNMKAGVNASL